MNIIARELRGSPILWLLTAVPIVFAVEHLAPDNHVTLFVLAVLAIVPLAALLSRATESVAAKTGDAVGGLLNATLGNLTELVIALTALRAGMFDLVKASIAGAIMTNSLFMLGMALLLGGMKHRVQEYNRATARFQAGLLFLAAIALMVPSLVGGVERVGAEKFTLQLSIGLSVLLLVAYVLGLVFSLGTHKKEFASAAHGAGEDEHLWPASVAAVLLLVVTVVVALVSEIFVESVQYAALAFGMTPAFVGFIIVSIVGAAAEMMAAFTAARKNRLDMSVGIALGSSSQIALFVAPVLVLLSLLIAPAPMDLRFWPGAVVAVLTSTLAVAFVTNGGRSAWYVGVLLLTVYAVFAVTLYLMPPATA
jgi:Ca2+:H+ antiporter